MLISIHITEFFGFFPMRSTLGSSLAAFTYAYRIITYSCHAVCGILMIYLLYNYKFAAFDSLLLTPDPHPLATIRLCSMSMSSVLSAVWSEVTQCLSCLTYFTEHNALGVHPSVAMDRISFFVAEQILSHCVGSTSLSIQTLMDIYAVSDLGCCNNSAVNMRVKIFSSYCCVFFR